MDQNFKISIITICKNSESTLPKCLASVLNQTYSNLEYVIVDGASTDGTMQIVNKFKNGISKIISEPDQGIYDAMNKGVLASTGDFILFLNADDHLISESAIDTLVQSIKKESKLNADIFYGKVLIYNKDNGTGNIWKAAKVSKFSLFRGSIPHPATIYTKGSFNKCGLFDTSYVIAGDYEWVVRAYLNNNLIFLPQNIIVSVFNKGGISTNKKYDILLKEEKNKIRNTYYNYWERKYYNFRWILRKNSILSKF